MSEGAQQIFLQAHCRQGVPPEDVWLHTSVKPPWPSRTTVASFRLDPQSDVRRHGILRGQWPYASFCVQNGHAVYRLGACERGVFEATLVESATFTPANRGGSR